MQSPFLKILALFALLLLLIPNLIGQSSGLSKSYKEETVEEAAQLLMDYYVFQELGEQAADHIRTLKDKGHFEPYQDLESFAAALSKSIYAITYDKHIRVSLKQAHQTTGDAFSQWVDSRMEERQYFRQNNANFKAIQKLHGNIGYLDLRGFYGLAWGKKFADYAMDLLSTSDAIIIDLRSNSGGRPDMVNYLLGYFFESPVITGRSVKRNGDLFTERTSYSNKITDNPILPNIPLYVLTSRTTFSAAEGFAYPLKIYKRATLIGETTRGGANAGDLLSLNDKLDIFIPDVAGKHPVKDESFDGAGIAPDIEARSGDALEIALELAREAAKNYRSENDAKARALLASINEIIANFEQNPDSQRMSDAYLACRTQHLIFEEWEIDALGSQYLEGGQPTTAEALFQTNTVLYPESPGAFDRMGNVLVQQGKTAEAIPYYERAVALSERHGKENSASYRDHLKAARKKQSKN